MKPRASRSGFPIQIIRNLAAIICSLVLVPGDMSLLARPAPLQAAAADGEAALIPADSSILWWLQSRFILTPC